MTDDGFVPKYVRWQVFDADDNLVDGVLTVSGTTTKVDGLGEYIYNGTGTTDLLKGLSIDVSGQTDTDLTHYRIIGLLSDCSADDNLVLNGTKVKEEPDFDLKVTVTFETAFRGKLTATAVEREVVFTQLATKWDYNTSGQEEFMLKISDDGKTVALQSKSGTTLIEKPLDILADLQTATGNTYTSLNSMENIYVRWYLERKDGSSTFVKGAVRKHNDSSTHFLPSNNTEGANLAHGFYWYKNVSTYSLTGGNAEGAVMVKFVQKGSDGPNPSINITDYNLVLNVSTHPYSEYDASYTNADHTINHEPDDLDIRYVFNFKEKDFPADNINTVKTIYKTALYDKSTGKITPKLFTKNAETVTLDINTSLANLAAKGYARWYVTDQSGNLVTDMTDWTLTAPKSYTKNDTYGYYVNLTDISGYEVGTQYDPTIFMPTTHNWDTDYKNYHVVCVVTTNTEGKALPTTEPAEMQVKYVFNLILTESEFANLPFVHYKGQSDRDWVTPGGTAFSQQVWNSETGEAEEQTVDIRQGVHTWEYDVFVMANDERELILPIEDYLKDSGNDDALEPRAYFRWYDYNTDKAVVENNFTLKTHKEVDVNATLLRELDGRGLFALNVPASDHPCQKKVGIVFKADDSFTEPIDIACDVSKYSDGMTFIGDNAYLVHEPTLSNRYIFHIHPASEIANDLAESKATLDYYQEELKKLDGLAKHTYYRAHADEMFALHEDKGRMVVSLGSKENTEFSLRLDEHSLANYVLRDGEGELHKADGIQWVAFYEGDEFILRKSVLAKQTDRICNFKWTDFQDDANNKYHKLHMPDTDENRVPVTNGMHFHVVAFVGSGTFDTSTQTGLYAPVAHYELTFMEAPPIEITDQTTLAAYNRTDAYMQYHYHRAGIVDFDGNPETDPRVTEETKDEYYSTPHWSDRPSSPAENMTWMPREWGDIQYGFCYPQLTSTIKNAYFPGTIVSPEHGDYMILKSMNANGLSNDNSDVTSPYKFEWWNATELYDYTHTVTDASKYGSFLYTDASDESRTMATIPFTGTLCGGSTLYFTAAVADMTSRETKPQLVVRIVAIDDQGKRNNLVAFHTSDISTAGATKSGVWYQVYGQSTLPTNFDESSVVTYEAEVINYAKNTKGADFALDQIAIYLSTAKVVAEQTTTVCDESGKVHLRIKANAETLINAVGAGNTKNIYYRLFERYQEGDGETHTIREKEALVGEGVYSDLTDAPTGYGVVEFTASYNISELTTTAPEGPGYYIEDGEVMFQLANRDFVLDPSKTYFVSIYSLASEKPGDTVAQIEGEAAGWGNPYGGNQCSTYSNDITPQQVFVQLRNEEDTEDSDGSLSIGCGETSVSETFNLQLKYPLASGGHEVIPDITFDIFLGDRATYKAVKDANTPATYLEDAIAGLRMKTTAAIASSSDLPTDYNTDYTAAMHDLLAATMNEGKLLLNASSEFTHVFNVEGEQTFMAIPVQKQISETDTRQICSPISLTFNVGTGGGGPVMAIGFDDVDYSKAPAVRGVRVGLEQLQKMRQETGNYLLHIPVQSFQDKEKGTTGKIYFNGGFLTVSGTNDPTLLNGEGQLTSTSIKLAKIVPTDDTDTHAYVAANRMYLALDLSGENCGVDFHEGFYYEVSAQIYDSKDDGIDPADRCTSEIFLTFKIVPEFVTWESLQIGSTVFYNANWNNDGNWQRSEREELYKGDTFGTQNTATAGHPNGYFNNLELNANLNTHPGYVPMKFTYVTMPTDNHAPDLNGMTYEAVGSEQTGGKLINLANTLNTNTSPVGTHVYNSASTAGIRYDLLVRYGDHADGGEGCFGHRTYNGTTWIDGSTTGLPAKVFDCEKFDGNICREIYFKPGAELLQQQRLRYQKAWVEKELTANKWYLMSSPLKGTYAGDMYVPTTNTEATNGRQLTEAFQPISFSDTPSLWEGTGVGSGSYSRTKYPIYQRSWGLDQAKVYTKVNDIRATDYSAKLNFGTLSTNIVEWSHTYNDVQVPYSTLGGFSIRAHKKDQTTPALIRLPKNDVTYDYYEWNGTDHPEPAAGVGIKSTPKGADVLGQFVYDWTLTNADNVQVGLTLSDVQSQGADSDGNTYYLVGNPFMGSLDMGKFFAQNTAFGNTYYTYEGSVLTAVDVTAAPSETDKHIIKPLQGFFVKCAAGSADRVIFDRRMMTDGNWEIGTAVTPANPAPALTPALTLTTEGSKATIVLNEEAAAGYEETEDVETLFDSNLADVPMVYTVSEGKAVTINHTSSLQEVCFGVTCNSDEMVDVTFDGVTDDLYVYDALTGESVSVGDGSTVTVQPNDYGRYFLTSTKASPLTLSHGEGADVLISVRGRQVTVTASADLQQVRALSVSGATVYQTNHPGTTCQFQLQQGTYVIETETLDGRKTMKVLVK